jgi:aerobic-type carbon monoxide dehydrogenase small subunit (CoxS/CutS family)
VEAKEGALVIAPDPAPISLRVNGVVRQVQVEPRMTLAEAFCTPGMIMSCAALLEHKSDPTADDVNAAIGGHFCRCGTYPHVVTATLAAASARKA